MTKVSYVVTYPNKTKEIVKTLAEARAASAKGATFKTVYSVVKTL
jgi:hypothetical protein